MAISGYGLFPQAVGARELAGQIGAGNVALQVTIDNAINAAVGLGLFTTTASVAGATSLNLQDVLSKLKQLGFTATVSGTTITVSWI